MLGAAHRELALTRDALQDILHAFPADRPRRLELERIYLTLAQAFEQSNLLIFEADSGRRRGVE